MRIASASFRLAKVYVLLLGTRCFPVLTFGDNHSVVPPIRRSKCVRGRTHCDCRSTVRPSRRFSRLRSEAEPRRAPDAARSCPINRRTLSMRPKVKRFCQPAARRSDPVNRSERRCAIPPQPGRVRIFGSHPRAALRRFSYRMGFAMRNPWRATSTPLDPTPKRFGTSPYRTQIHHSERLRVPRLAGPHE